MYFLVQTVNIICFHFMEKRILFITLQPKYIGLSKIISILNYYSARLQTQERLAQQVAYCIKRLIRPRALIIRLTCKHTCMMIRNVKSICSSTSVLLMMVWSSNE